MKSIFTHSTKSFIFHLVSFFSLTMAVAQTTTTFPNPNSCTSGDLELVGATLVEGVGCDACDQIPQEITRTLKVSINNTTGSTRTSFAFWGQLEIYDGNTGLLKPSESGPISGCGGPLPGNTITSLATIPIKYTCGDILKITNLFLAWTDASPGSTCASLNSATIAPKCGTLPSIKIENGVNGEFAVTNLQCFGSNNGSIDLTPTGGTAPYSYTWTASDGGIIPVGQEHSQDLNGLVAGIYTVRIEDANHCSITKSRTIIQPENPLIATIDSAVNVNCKGGATGSATASATGGTAAYTYSWNTNPIQNTAVASGLAAGTYTVTVTDSKGCSDTEQITITEPQNALVASIGSVANVNCKGAATGSATASATGGTAAYTYSWNTNPIQNTAVAAGLAAGTYTVTVTDSKGCTDTEQITITEPQNVLVASIGSVSNVNCKGAATGSATASATGGTAAYTYSWNTNPVQNTAVASGLTAGTYTVTVTDSKGCTDTEQITITEPQDMLVASIGSVANVNCKGGATGSATASATGGTAAYTYSWNTNPVQNAALASGLTAGTYIVTVTDSKGCTDTEQITISEPKNTLVASIGSVANVNCKGGATGSATASATGGTPVYTYSWNTNPVQNTAVASGLAAGTYTVTVTDSKGCTDTEQITITEPQNVLVASIGSVTNVNCKGDATGSATASATGGTPAYTYSWNTNPVQNTAVASGLAAGTYTVTVTDSKGCTDTEQITITEPQDVLTCSIVQDKAVSSNGLSDGEATVTPLGGNGGYTYLWDNGETTAKALGLNVGLHTVTITDSKGCQTTCQVTISQPDVLSCSIIQHAPAKCYGDSNGIASVTAVGGNGEYTYLWDNGETTAQAIALNAGNHSVTVTDKLGYQTTCNITVGQPNAALSCSIIQNKAVSSNGLSDGEATVTPLGGNGGYTYLWDNGETTVKAVGLNVGLHTVTITDSKGCQTTCQVTISQPDVLSCSIIQDAPAKCYGDSNGIASVTAVGGNGEYSYLWDNGETTAQAIALNAGNHSVTVTDKLGYQTTCNITVGQPNAALSCSIIQNKAVSSNGLSDGEATVTPLGGNGGYTYLWDNGETTAKALGLNVGLHTVIVTDSKGCQTTCQVTISQPDVLSCSIIQDAPAKCYGDNNGIASVTAVGGNGEYTYLWDNGETTAQAIALNAGNHSVTVTDKLGYQTTCNITVEQPNAALSATAIIVNNNNCVGCSNGSITQTVSGGTSPYTYLWSNGSTTKDINSLSKGTYSVEIKDYNGCIINYTYTIVESGIALVKTGTFNDSNSDGYAQAGETISYAFSVTNTGEMTLTNISITDPLVTIIGGPITTLSIGTTDSTTFTASYLVTQSDIDAGMVINSALAIGKDSENIDVKDISGTDINNDTKTITQLIQSSSIVVSKDGFYNDTNKDGITNVGDKVIYNFTVKNTGNVTLKNITIADLLPGLEISGAPIDLEPNAIDNSTFTAFYSITQKDINAGFVYNLATVSGTPLVGEPVTSTSTDPTPCVSCPVNPDCPAETDCSNYTVTPLNQTPSLVITKDGTYIDTNEDGITNIGDKVAYNFTVRNNGNVPLTNITIHDLLPDIQILGGPIDLEPNAIDSNTFTAFYTIKQNDINTGFVYNLAIATGKPPLGEPVSATSTDPTPCTSCPANPNCPAETDCSSYTVTPLNQNPRLQVTKTATVSSNGNDTDVYSFVGDVINYTIIVKNTGNVTLHDIIVIDELTGLTTQPIATLAPGESLEAILQTYTITKNDLAQDSVVNIAKATAKDPNGVAIPPASGTVTVEKASVLGCESIVVHNAFSPNGDGINETFIIDGIGDTTCYPENTVEIYNRWGVLVFETTNYNNQTNVFDGYSRGRTTISKSSGLPTGTYYYILNYTSVDLSGNIQTNRKDGYLYLTR
ncbi:DUF7507 domain-containing protein [Flavobacterium granuli]|uniref:Conserved repeat domain-containing protein/gliding motility-associated C-terminal domain-containing protein n=1 Tax=Flavobacterium granuli TaxID=280093 RepID=A0A1M5PZ57_9FLAO|nr:gliding motility-associated C-terminal domain-containing protein [Flavobacterium granuli]PRZ22004.1 putative repeat protein (TIGR01451 family)/gliding motility-associated-like protein [Flavobacterium granuli]SHH06946.1 conserved repeat domain-containing protein/gliding motility-associated C-terminal domain-containing protein [Flavobacterium granuli]